MKMKSALYVLAVAVLMGTMAVAALADDHGMNMYGPPDASLSADPERSVGLVDVGEIRGPVETGAIPDGSGSSYEVGSNPVNDEPTEEVGGQIFRQGLDTGA